MPTSYGKVQSMLQSTIKSYHIIGAPTLFRSETTQVKILIQFACLLMLNQFKVTCHCDELIYLTNDVQVCSPGD